MSEEPNSEEPVEKASSPKQRAEEKAAEFRMLAEIGAVFEGTRKFGDQIKPDLKQDIARDVQQTIARLDKHKILNTPVIEPQSIPEAIRLLSLPETLELSTGDYHVRSRPGETMVVRWLNNEQVENFYQRLQAHFDATLDAFREEERQAKEWKNDPDTNAYLDALDDIKDDLSEKYLREQIQKHNVVVLSTQTADEISITFLTEYVMGVSVAELVGEASAPPDSPSNRDLAWFYKLFALRGKINDEERMCFFVYLQKTEDTFDTDW